MRCRVGCVATDWERRSCILVVYGPGFTKDTQALGFGELSVALAG